MKLDKKKTGPWQHTLSIELPAEDLEARLEKSARKIQRRANLPGFRKGKVPLAMIRQQFAEVIEQDFLESELGVLAGEAVAEAGLKPVVPPLVRELKLSPGQPLQFEAVVDERPEVEAKNYKGLKVTSTAQPVEEAQVDQVIERLREDSAVFEDLDRPAEKGDIVLFDSTRLDANGRRLKGSKAKDRRIELGTPDLMPDLENGLQGAEAGQERTIDVNYPADYPVAELAGQQARYVIRVRKIQEKKLRPMDDNWAKDVFKLDSFEQLRERVRQNLEGEENTRARRDLENAVSTELLKNNDVDLPERLVQWMLDRVIREATEGKETTPELLKELEKNYKEGVEQSLRREILLDAIARQEKLEVSDDDVTAEIDRMAQSDPRQAARVRAHYRDDGRREGLKDRLRERKALDWLIEAADVKEGAGGKKKLVVPATR